MAKIIISHVFDDSQFVDQINRFLEAAGHEIINWKHGDLKFDRPTTERFFSALKSVDAMLVILSEKSLHSEAVMFELGAADGLASGSERPIIIPVLLDNISGLPSITGRDVVFAKGRDVDEVASLVIKVIALQLGKLAAEGQKTKEVAEKIEQNAAEYILKAITAQQNLRFWNGFWGKIWYFLGFGSLIIGIYFALISLASRPAEANWFTLVSVVITNVITIGFLGACARYAFSLGKAYTSEALKSSDRIHAISFGEFYLRAFGDKTSWSELKEVFQHWNIDRTSTFSGLDASQIDPQILSLIGQIASTIGSKNKDKDKDK